VQLITRTIQSTKTTSGALEIYISAIPQTGSAAEAREMFASVEAVVTAYGATACRERVFVPQGRLTEFHAARKSAYNGKSERVPTDWLWAGAADEPVGGIQLHAIRGPTDWQPLRIDGVLVGWTLRQDGCRWLVTGGLTSPNLNDDGPHQTRTLFEEGEDLLSHAGMCLADVARTWIYMDHILGWYAPFNEVRNRLFVERGLLRRGGFGDAPLVPASTGMGVTPAGGGRIALELFAVEGPEAHAKRYSAAGKQKSAYEYGSAFARAAEAHTPAGRTLFVSGTAAIDTAGKSCHIGDASAQIDMTINNVLAVLNTARCSPRDVVQAIAYCKTPQVAEAFASQRAHQPSESWSWPWLTVIGDVCRDELLFEAEVTACEAAPAGIASYRASHN
jgi:enamine deaminase RidA (YjgF/YER057c/UK114 family)